MPKTHFSARDRELRLDALNPSHINAAHDFFPAIALGSDVRCNPAYVDGKLFLRDGVRQNGEWRCVALLP